MLRITRNFVHRSAEVGHLIRCQMSGTFVWAKETGNVWLVEAKIYPVFVLNYITNIVKQTALYKSNILKIVEKQFGFCVSWCLWCSIKFDLSGVIEKDCVNHAGDFHWLPDL